MVILMDPIIAHLENNGLLIPKNLLNKIGAKDQVQIKVKNNNLIITPKTITDKTVSEILKKINNIAEDAKDALYENEILTEIVLKIITRIEEFFESIGKKYLVDIYIYRDIEIPTWKDFTLRIYVETKRGFEEIKELWNKIAKVVDEVITDMKIRRSEFQKEIEKIDRDLAVIVCELEI